MAILSPVEAKSTKGRLVHLAIIALLTLGGATMVYPFIIMVSGSMRSEIDAADLDLLPAYLTDDAALYRKFLETKYGYDIAKLRRQHLTSPANFATVESSPGSSDAADDAAVDALRDFLSRPDLPRHWVAFAGVDAIDTASPGLRELRERLRIRFDDDLQAYAREAGASPSSWLGIMLTPPDWADRRFDTTDEPIWEEYFNIVENVDPAELYLTPITGTFLESIIYPVYGRGGPEAYNRDHVEPIDSYEDLRLPATVPGEDQPRLRAEWTELVRDVLNPTFIVTRGVDPQQYRDHLQETYAGVDELNKAWGTAFDGWQQVELPDGRRWLAGPERQDYTRFLASLPVEALELTGPEFAWRQFAVERDLAPTEAQAPRPPMPQLEMAYVLADSGDLRWEFATQNYRAVWSELVLEGRALMNTVIYCALAICTTLLINPLAAYGLSRYQLPGTYKVLLILMATMAFPPMVALLPQYVLLRNMNLMNTFVALLLPLAANGYMIFLLKGFFDSLPRELYEAARIDGAGEIRMFFQITMSLSKPILAVLALDAFTSAYAAFLYPLLVAPDPDMWLIAVWLYQFQQRASSGAVFASVIIASIPTLVIFLFVQRTIMRGIVVPTEK